MSAEDIHNADVHCREVNAAVVQALLLTHSIKHQGLDGNGPQSEQQLRTGLWNRAAITTLFVQLTSAINEGLGHYIRVRHPGHDEKTQSLGAKIAFLRDTGELADPDSLMQAKDIRNRLAHEKYRFATWDEMVLALEAAHRELGRLGVIVTGR